MYAVHLSGLENIRRKRSLYKSQVRTLSNDLDIIQCILSYDKVKERILVDEHE